MTRLSHKFMGFFYKPHYQAKVSDPSLMARFLFSEFVIKMNKMGLVMLTHPFGCGGEKKTGLSLDITKNKAVDIKIDKNKRL